MTQALWLFALLGLAAMGGMCATTNGSRGERWLQRGVMFFALVLAPLLLLGMAQQLLGYRIVSIAAAVLVLLPVTVAIGWWRRSAVAAAIRSENRSSASLISLGTAWLIVALFSALGLFLLLSGVPRGFEVNAYHLPLAVNFFRDGSVDFWSAAFTHTYTANMSLWSGLFLVALPERITAVTNFPFLALAALAIHQLCRAVGTDRSLSLLCAAGLTTIPVFSFSAIEIGADVAGVAMIAAASYFALARPSCFPSWPVMAGISAGLAFGFKSLHLVPIAVLGMIVLIDGLRGRTATATSARVTLADRLRPAAAFGGWSLALAGLWLTRNWLATGNPLYPVHVAGVFDVLGWPAAPDVDFSGHGDVQLEWVEASWRWLIYPWVEGHFIDQNFKHSSGFGAYFAAVMPIGAVVGAWLLYRESRSGRVAEAQARLLRRLLTVTAVIVAVWWILDDRQPRYVMAAVALLLPVCGWAATHVRPPLRAAYEAMIAVAILFMGAVLLVQFGATQVSLLAASPVPPRHQTLEYPAALDQLPAGAVVLNTRQRVRNYALYGAQLSNRVVSYSEAVRVFQADDGQWRLTDDAVRALDIGYIYGHGEPNFQTDGCVAINEFDRLARNPFNGSLLPQPRILYQVTLCSER